MAEPDTVIVEEDSDRIRSSETSQKGADQEEIDDPPSALEWDWKEWSNREGEILDQKYKAPARSIEWQYFYPPWAPPGHAELWDAESALAILSSLGGLFYFIPSAEPVISGIEAFINLFLPSQGAQDDRTLKAIQELEANIKDFFNKRDIESSYRFVKEVGDSIRSWANEEVFKYNDVKHRERVHEVETQLHQWVDGIEQHASFRNVLDELRKRWTWGDNELLGMLLTALNIYAQCMELLGILAANRAVAARKAGDEEEATYATQAFYDKGKQLRTFLTEQNDVFRAWINDGKSNRNNALTSVQYSKDRWIPHADHRGIPSEFGYYTHKWSWKDQFAERY